MNFTYNDYFKMVDSLKEHGYIFADYETCDKFNKCVIFRHDVDFSIDHALKLSEMEHDKSIKSTYFILLSSDFYNIISKEIREKIKSIKRMGHDIGLHFDETNYNIKSDDELYKRVSEEIGIMEQILGLKIKTVSMHRPSQRTLEADYDLTPHINSYGKKFFKDFKYLSDSRCRWRESVNELIQDERYKKLHILTHAFWYGDYEESTEMRLKEFILKGNKDRFGILRRNISNINELVKENVYNE